MKITIQAIAHALDAHIQNDADVTVTSTAFDSRQVTPGALFIPLVAENDGHTYLNSAIQNGAVASLWQKDHTPYPTNVPLILVDDTLEAFQALAEFYLKQVDPKIVAISGSNGKTTTKDFIAAIGNTKYKTVKTPANFNNEIGVPTTILSMDDDTELLVLEMGMDHPGDLDKLSKMVQPDIAVLTMIGEAHIEFFKTRANIADGKMQIINGFKPNSQLVYNGDEPLLVDRVGAHDELHNVSFGLTDQNDLFASNIEMTATQAIFTTNASKQQFTIPLTGRYNVANALAAISVGHLLEIDDATIAEALRNAPITANRTQWLKGNFGGEILSDVYNSNPTAAKEVLNSFSAVPTQGRRIAVLGDMLELGTAGPELHASLAEALDPKKIEKVYLVGDLMTNLADALVKFYPADHIHTYQKDELPKLTQDLQKQLTASDLLLLKGSHGIHLENVVDALVNK
ncbi:UDP-N-acetylmuramoyl-tripeptide--D-alanyl-D-alanine ligase [Weissella uvarum]|uniref:UDP-N-acetylmuramoyl-tripeptide--D-alanyl-D- alanine ligase n=1 Tax=Weissella uvarum TaxID=1479233 RepID=UPI00195F5DC6|nr:UDP-N-acetylmuramoyl-tripeptide--D-alanyl-D-alanine ligase [Weissella uvarum]MBM7617699.1 UDP-N-acetylmuramoyl-tripeptide--D-alanyl-D-alanine ligase [Weissella uvarum]MCM0596048.1 UDP-N-acetylmuramoyl-tripeptide--D-alanyl-D-alanine ligase [Weissella uvarum]